MSQIKKIINYSYVFFEQKTHLNLTTWWYSLKKVQPSGQAFILNRVWCLENILFKIKTLV